MFTDNLINKLLINLKLPNKIGRVEALAVSQQYYETLVYPAIERVFDKYKNYDIQIEKIDIDIKKVKIEDISVLIFQLLEEQIKKNINIEKSSLITKFTNKFTTTDKFQIFIHYLKYAEIPWYSRDKTKFNIEKIVQEIFIESGIEKLQLNEMIKLFYQNKIALQRFYYLTDDETLDKILKSIVDFYEKVKIIYNIISTPIAEIQATQKKEIRKYFFEILLQEFHSDKINIDKIINNFTKIFVQKLQSSVFEKKINEALFITNYAERIESVMEIVFEYFTGKTKNKKSIMFDENEKFSQSNEFNVKQKSKNKNILLRPEILNEQKLESNAELNKIIYSDIYFDDEKRIQITNAGLVILNPMIKFLFDALGFLDTSGIFKSENFRFRAVHVLQSVTGIAGKHYEHLMPLNKIICGMDLQMPINPEFKIKKNERTEINDLLKAVLQHWNVLKSTSAKGLQESFIQRKGTIEKSSKDWIVRVENSGIDLLLDDLPWSINILKYPWNDYIIHVEWKH